MGMSVLPILTIVVLHLLVHYMYQSSFQPGFPSGSASMAIRQTLEIPPIQNVTHLNLLLIYYHHGNGASNSSFFLSIKVDYKILLANVTKPFKIQERTLFLVTYFMKKMCSVYMSSTPFKTNLLKTRLNTKPLESAV